MSHTRAVSSESCCYLKAIKKISFFFFFFHLFVFGFGLHGLPSILKFLFCFFSKNWSAVQTDSSLNALIVKLHFQKALPQVVSLRMRMENWTSRGDLASSRCEP